MRVQFTHCFWVYKRSTSRRICWGTARISGYAACVCPARPGRQIYSFAGVRDNRQQNEPEKAMQAFQQALPFSNHQKHSGLIRCLIVWRA